MRKKRAPKKKPDPSLVIDVITLFPGTLKSPLRESMIRIALEKGLVTLNVHDLRDYAHDKRRTCDDKPFGGGPGMVMTPEPIFEAFEDICGPDHRKIYLSPQGAPFTHETAERLAKVQRMALLCGHYEGVDERVRQHLIDEEISIGDYVTSGGEIPALVLIDAIVRLVPGVLGNKDSLHHESFNDRMFDYPQYTRPRNFRGYKVPDILVSGDHAEVAAWRKKQAVLRTQAKRPDLLSGRES